MLLTSWGRLEKERALAIWGGRGAGGGSFLAAGLLGVGGPLGGGRPLLGDDEGDSPTLALKESSSRRGRSREDASSWVQCERCLKTALSWEGCRRALQYGLAQKLLHPLTGELHTAKIPVEAMQPALLAC